MTWIYIPLSTAIGYLLGSVSFAVLVAGSRGINILEVGSGNPGATNVLRVLGKPAGYTVFVLDFLKGLVGAGWPAVAASAGLMTLTDFQVSWMGIAGLAGAILGHSFSFMLGFRGGKGVATATGGLAALMFPVILVAVVLWTIVFYMFRYVSFASIVMGAALPPLAWLFGMPVEQIGLCVVLAALIVIRHKSNIRKLLDGTEHKFEKKRPLTPP